MTWGPTYGSTGMTGSDCDPDPGGPVFRAEGGLTRHEGSGYGPGDGDTSPEGPRGGHSLYSVPSSSSRRYTSPHTRASSRLSRPGSSCLCTSSCGRRTSSSVSFPAINGFGCVAGSSAVTTRAASYVCAVRLVTGDAPPWTETVTIVIDVLPWCRSQGGRRVYGV